MRKLWIFFLGLCLSGCYRSPFLPDKPRDLSEFIPRPEVEIVHTIASGPFDFVSEHFPEDCEWKTFERVIDGDTIFVEGSVSVRFIGIDTPETKHPDKPIQKGGIEASTKTKELLEGAEKVCLIFDTDGDKYDTYDDFKWYMEEDLVRDWPNKNAYGEPEYGLQDNPWRYFDDEPVRWEAELTVWCSTKLGKGLNRLIQFRYGFKMTDPENTLIYYPEFKEVK